MAKTGSLFPYCPANFGKSFKICSFKVKICSLIVKTVFFFWFEIERISRNTISTVASGTKKLVKLIGYSYKSRISKGLSLKWRLLCQIQIRKFSEVMKISIRCLLIFTKKCRITNFLLYLKIIIWTCTFSQIRILVVIRLLSKS